MVKRWVQTLFWFIWKKVQKYQKQTQKPWYLYYGQAPGDLFLHLYLAQIEQTLKNHHKTVI